LVDAAPALLVDGEFCAEVLEGLVRSTEDAEDALWSVLPAAGAADPGVVVVVLDELLWLDTLLPTLLADVSFDAGGGVVVVDWLFVGLALLGEPGIELLGEVAAAPAALWSEDVLELVELPQESEIMLTELTCILLLSACVPFTST
jgi:hypothetical protein